MSISAAFGRNRPDGGRAALLPFLVAGDPALERLPDIIEAVVEGGADVVELGIPYSDPLADGPTIQSASQRALVAGSTFERVLASVASLDRSRVPAPILAFTYYNPLFVRGLGRAASELARAGFAGAIIPDLPVDEADAAEAAFSQAGIGITGLIAPTTPADRASLIARRSSGFVYVVSRTGVTGASQAPAAGLRALVAGLRAVTHKPLAVGFGVSTPEQAAAIAEYADGVVVGSALVDAIARARAGEEAAAAREFCSSLAAAMRTTAVTAGD